jgi:hypothetical protein
MQHVAIVSLSGDLGEHFPITLATWGSRSNGTKNVDPLEGVVFTPHTREESALLRR